MNLNEAVAALAAIKLDAKGIITMEINKYDRGRVHLTRECFRANYGSYERGDHCEKYDRIWVIQDGIMVFALVDKEAK